MIQLAPLDWLWLSLFLILMIGTGVAFYRLARRSEAVLVAVAGGRAAPEIEW